MIPAGRRHRPHRDPAGRFISQSLAEGAGFDLHPTKPARITRLQQALVEVGG